LPVGNFFTFFVNMLVSMSFDFIGFLLTSLLATSHAARCGSRSGFGVTLLRYGFYIKTKALEGGLGPNKYYDPENPETDEDIAVQNEWISYILIMRANADFVRVKRMREIVLAPPEGSPA
ncbi:hypothetical protein HK104_002997, partial [Borealophlyctis nickersoniae]